MGALAAAVLAVSCGAQAATPAVSSGAFHSIALRSDGRVLSWGNDFEGQLGVGRLLFRSTPAAIAGASNVRSVALGTGFGLALTRDGRVLAWGSNDNGQLGDGSYAYRGNAVVQARISDVVQLAPAERNAAALKADGTVWTWGGWPLGDGLRESRAAPAPLAELSDVVQVSASRSHTLAVKRDGTVWGWGQDPFALDFSGERTLAGDLYYRATRLAPLSDVRTAFAGDGFSFFIRNDGTLWGWGNNHLGTLGELPADVPLPVRIPGVSGVKWIAASSSHVLALREDGTVLSWGSNFNGQLGRADAPRDGARPAPIPGLAGVVAIAAGGAHSLALTADGAVWAWGLDTNGEAGQPVVAGIVVRTPTRIPGLAGADSIGAGYSFSAASAGGAILTWGANERQQLASGLEREGSLTAPSLVPGLQDVVMVAAGSSSSFAITADGGLWAWGREAMNALGIPITEGIASPVRVPGLPPIASVSARSHVLALDRDGRIWAWGRNLWGQLGNGTTSNVTRAELLPTPERITAVAAGYSHSLAVTASARVLAWGTNFRGELGDGTTTDRLTPQYAIGLPAVEAVAAGSQFSLAKTPDGAVWAWGAADDGQLGIGDAIDAPWYPTPRRVPGLENVRRIEAGGSHAVALLPDGTLWGWGSSVFGQLGIGYSDSSLPLRFSPVPLRFGFAAIRAMSASGLVTFAVAQDGLVAGTGWNTDGELADGTFVDRYTPQLAVGVEGVGYLDLTPEDPAAPPGALRTPFGVVTFGEPKASQPTVDAKVFFNAPDVGSTRTVYVFAIAPADLVRGAAADAALPLHMKAKRDGKDTPVQCVLAQLNAAGQLVGVSVANLQGYVTGVLTAQGQSVNIINGVPAANIGGATFFVGYGSSAGSMINGGINRSVVAVPGPSTCQPQPPQTGWWWNPAEDGRGFSIEKRGNNLFFASFLYDVSGRSTWHVSSGPVSLDGSLYTGDLLSARGGQTLGGSYPGFPTLRSEGPITLAFNTATTGTMVWPGGTVPIRRFDIVPNGAGAGPAANAPESGWWWNEQEPGRGFFMEWQGATLDIAGYMYDEAGDPVWYLTVGSMGGDNNQTFSGSWWSYGNGQTLTGAWKPNARINGNVAPVTITFSAADTALMTLPNGRTTSLRRHRF